MPVVANTTKPAIKNQAPEANSKTSMANTTTPSSHQSNHNSTTKEKLVKGEEQKDGYGHPIKDKKPPEGDKSKGKDKYGYHGLTKNMTHNESTKADDAKK